MQKKLYIGGLPWEIDRIGLLNYFKAVLEGNSIEASYEPPFITTPLSNPNSAIKVVDVFVAMDKQTGKSRGFGFVTVDLPDDSDLFEKLVEIMNKRVMLGIRGPRELIVNEAEPRNDAAPTDAPRQQEEPEAESGANSLSW